MLKIIEKSEFMSLKLKLGINGFGRIGKIVFRILQTHPNIEVSLINDPMPLETMVYLLKYDSIHGPFNAEVKIGDNGIIVNGNFIPVSTEKDPENIPWKKYGLDLILESSGKFKTRALLEKHLKAGAEKVILSCPSDEPLDLSLVIGVNDDQLQPHHNIISNASCTTNCLAPLLKVIDENLGVVSGFLNTIHPYTNNQSIIDSPHAELRRSRAASNIIPTTSTAIQALFEIMPKFKGRFDGFATRVPVPDGSFIELCLNLEKQTDVESINQLIKTATETHLKGIVQYTLDPIVSSDVVNNPHSAVFDSLATKVVNGNFVQMIAWYDNEYGYSNRVVDTIERMASLNRLK